MEEYTMGQWFYYHRFNILNLLLGLYVLVQFVQLIWDIYRDIKCNECIHSSKCSNNSGKRGGSNSLSVIIKDSIINSKLITRHTSGGGRKGK